MVTVGILFTSTFILLSIASLWKIHHGLVSGSQSYKTKLDFFSMTSNENHLLRLNTA